MNNAEKYKDQITKILAECDYFALVDGKPAKCDDNITCDECGFNRPLIGCHHISALWLMEECTEPKVDWSKVAVDTPILVSDDGGIWVNRHFSKCENGNVYAWSEGTTSWSRKHSHNDYTEWEYAKLVDD